VDTLVSQFSLDSARIQSVAAQVRSRKAITELPEILWDACRLQARPRLEGLAQRIDTLPAWDVLVLPEKQKELLRLIAVHVRQRRTVYQDWGFASKGSRGLGISALFAGPSGTGKTMAAEVLANDLRLDLYRIDLSQVVSKYIGETEKNLRRVFDAADEGAAVLLFDEADALFGKRTEVKDSHDRYANIEISYLLQRMEAYRGLAILTTTRKNALDQAFLRRIRFVVDFPFPGVPERAEIWRGIFPAATPTEGLRVERLARLNAAGGNIRNIALGAAFLAADAGEPVRMTHLLSATRQEFAKIEKPLSDAEVAGWL
jgi:SpoVK/Ycf46/Vps4 family AAA+-type ATPase